jgi:hypothetical protein
MIGLEFNDAKRDLMLDNVNQALTAYAVLRRVAVENSVVPALRFDPLLPGIASLPRAVKRAGPRREASVARPATPAELAFLSGAELGSLRRAGKVTSTPSC